MLDLRGREPEALGALANLYEKQGMWWDLAEVFERELSLLQSDEDRINVLSRRARLYADKLKRLDLALVDWGRVLELDPSNMAALRAVVAIHRQERSAKPLAVALHALVDRASHILDAEEIKDVFRELARIYAEELDAPHNAAHAWKRLLAVEADPQALDALESFYRAEGQWDDVVEVKMMRADAIVDLVSKIEEYKRIAAICNETLLAPDAATPAYQKILELKPSSDEAFRELETRHLAAGRFQALVELYLARFDARSEPRERAELLRRIARICEEEFGDDDEAFVALQTALKEDVDDRETVVALERLAGKLGRFPELVEDAKSWLDASAETKVKIRLCMHIAKWYGEDLGQPELAQPYFARILELDPESVGSLQVYREVLAADPNNLLALRGLAQAYESLGEWPDLLQVLERELALVTTQRERIVVLMRIAQLQEQHFLKADVAAKRLEEVLEIHPFYEMALFDLERNYKKARRWRELARTLDRHATASSDPRTKVELLTQMAEIHTGELEDVKRAIGCYRGIIDLDEDHAEAHAALAKLYERQGDVRRSVKYQTRVAELTEDPRQRAEAYFRVGQSLESKLGDRAAARERYEAAIAHDPTHVRALAALKQIAMADGDYDAAARYLDQEQTHTEGKRQRARLLVELANLHASRRHDAESASRAFEAAHQMDGENEEAVSPLLDAYLTQDAWAEAEPLLELTIRKSSKRSKPELRALYNKLGAVCAKLGKHEKALKAYGAAYQLDISDATAVRGVAEAAFHLGDWNTALAKYLRVLTSLGDVTPEERRLRGEVHFKLGCIKQELSQRKQAAGHFEKALESIDAPGAILETLQACITLHEELKDWEKVVTYQRRVLNLLSSEEERFAMLERIADVWSQRAGKPAQAIAALEEARALRPTSHALLYKLLALYQSAEDWTRMLETIQEIANLDPDPGRRAKFYYTMAKIHRDKKDDPERAVALFDEALDLNPLLVEAFERITKILTSRGEWKSLERAFRRMLRRLAALRKGEARGEPSGELEYNLWHGLGLVYRDRLHDMVSAVESFKMAARFRDDAATARQILAELFEGLQQEDAAASEIARTLSRDPTRDGPYRALCRLYLKQHEYDRAFCACAALAFLNKADESERRFFEDSRPRGMLQVRGRIANEHWIKNLFHEDEDLFIGKLFDMVTPAAIVVKTQKLLAARQLPVLERRFKQDRRPAP